MPETDLITEVEALLAKAEAAWVSIECRFGDHSECHDTDCNCEHHDRISELAPELLRRLVEEVKANRETLLSLKNCQNKPVCGHCNALLRHATRNIIDD